MGEKRRRKRKPGGIHIDHFSIFYMVRNSSKNTCYYSCIQRSCKAFVGVHVAAVQARHVPNCKYTIYAIYLEDVATGRSWIILRRFSEIYEMRRSLRHALEKAMANADRVFQFEEIRLLLKQLDMLKFPHRFHFGKGDQKVLRQRAQMIATYLQGLIDLVKDGLLNAAMFYGKKRAPFSAVGSIKSTLVVFLGGSADIYSTLQYQIPEPIPQTFLTPEKRVVVSRCGNLDTVVECEVETSF